MSAATRETERETVQRLVERTVFTPVRGAGAVAETVARLGEAIGLGLLRPGDRLPSETQLASALGISAASLRSALVVLRSAGLIETRRGRGGGTFVTQGAAEAVLAAAEAPTAADLEDLSSSDPAPGPSSAGIGDLVGGATGAVNDAVRGGLHTMSRLASFADPSRLSDAMNLVANTPDIVNKLLLAGCARSSRIQPRIWA